MFASALKMQVFCSDVAQEISFRLPLHSASNFPDMLEELDASLRQLGLIGFGISGAILGHR